MLSSPTRVHNTEEDISDNEDEQLTGTVHATLMTKSRSESKPFVARFIKLSPFKSLDPELPRVKIIIVGDANTGKSCFLHKYIHGCFDYQSQPTVSLFCVCVYIHDLIVGGRGYMQFASGGQENRKTTCCSIMGYTR